ncbi:MAG TPA: ferrous iron transport protein A [Chlorobaculum sp.]|jgi:ferrous iron transport protein A|uniref:Ferrous iron transport protein A n=2 Tax=Chlorobaculum tepidum TaxID=1097 RepID=Q8KGB1_CHLTE|nr:FeoA family protein [Chlorobaculum tepidum]AAM71305.1 ferrous iron transport protein A [Chlorobaculum tepidum TLS]HBU24314.1 ferrous iron transport protein A [Chlorobaculum sp.]
MKLSELKAGDRAEVTSVAAEPAVRRRLMDLGLVRGAKLKVLRFAPLGDPIEVNCNGMLLTMRRNEAEGITVHILAGDEGHPHGWPGFRRRHRFGKRA